MHKKVTISLATILATTGITPVAFAEENPVKEQIEENISEEASEGDIGDSVIIENDEEAEEEDKEDKEEEVELIDTLTLEDAINYGMTSNYSILSLEYNLENIKSQLAGTEDKHRELRFDIRDLERDMDRLRKQGSATFQERYQIQEALKDMRDVLKDMEDGIEGIKTNEKIIGYTNEQTEEIMPFQIISTYIQIIMQEEQVKLQEEGLKTQEQQVANTKREYEVGIVSKSDYEAAVREVTRLEAQIAEARENIQKDLKVFALDIGIMYHSDLTLQNPNLGEATLVTQEIDTKELIENSYSMKIAEEKLALELYNQEQVYEDDDADKFDREQADIAVELERIDLAEAKRDAQQAITELYTNIYSQYYSLDDAKREIQYAKEDLANMEKRFQIGVISKQDYELSKMNLTQAEAKLQLETYNYFLLTKQADLLESGVILIN